MEPNESLPATETISAVFLVAFHNGKLLSIQNERGWDIPGGHIEGDEKPLVALRREALEEAGAKVGNASPYAILTSTTSSKIMVFFASNDITMVDFVPSEDALDRGLLDTEDLLARYYGDKELLGALIEGVEQMLN